MCLKCSTLKQRRNVHVLVDGEGLCIGLRNFKPRELISNSWMNGGGKKNRSLRQARATRARDTIEDGIPITGIMMIALVLVGLRGSFTRWIYRADTIIVCTHACARAEIRVNENKYDFRVFALRSSYQHSYIVRGSVTHVVGTVTPVS